jgi:hypothetical protein
MSVDYNIEGRNGGVWIIIIIISFELAFALMSVSHKQQLITSVNT